MTPDLREQPDPPIVEQRLVDIKSALERSGLAPDQIAGILPEIRDTLIETARTTARPTEGGPKVIKGDHFYGVKDMGGQVIESGVKLVIGAILAGHGHIDPLHAKEAAVDALIGLRKTILKLDDAQKVVCVAIMDISSRKRSRIFIEPGASADEIRNYFTARNAVLPPGLEKILDGLSQGETKVLESATYGGRGPFYQVRF
jgi:hypothetical protein